MTFVTVIGENCFFFYVAILGKMDNSIHKSAPLDLYFQFPYMTQKANIPILLNEGILPESRHGGSSGSGGPRLFYLDGPAAGAVVEGGDADWRESSGMVCFGFAQRPMSPARPVLAMQPCMASKD
jgi:hypothetical protein